MSQGDGLVSAIVGFPRSLGSSNFRYVTLSCLSFLLSQKFCQFLRCIIPSLYHPLGIIDLSHLIHHRLSRLAFHYSNAISCYSYCMRFWHFDIFFSADSIASPLTNTSHPFYLWLFDVSPFRFDRVVWWRCLAPCGEFPKGFDFSRIPFRVLVLVILTATDFKGAVPLNLSMF